MTYNSKVTYDSGVVFRDVEYSRTRHLAIEDRAVPGKRELKNAILQLEVKIAGNAKDTFAVARVWSVRLAQWSHLMRYDGSIFFDDMPPVLHPATEHDSWHDLAADMTNDVLNDLAADAAKTLDIG